MVTALIIFFTLFLIIVTIIFFGEEGLAVDSKNGHKQWWLNGRRHREGGPAIEYSNGGKYWYLNGIQYETKESYFDALYYEGKRLCLISEDFLNA